MDKILFIYFAIHQTLLCSAQPITVTVGDDVTIPCTSVSAYPVWFGPEKHNGNAIVYNNPGYREFASPYIPQQKKARLDWASDNKGLVIKNVSVSDEGLYQCSDQTNLYVRVPSSTPVILNTETLSDNTLIIRGSQSKETELVCISAGGYPQQQVEWYRGNTGTQPLISTSSVTVGNNSFNVTETYTFSPDRQDDGVEYICQSSFQTEPRNIKSTKVQLILNLQPNQPTVVQTSVISAGSVVEIRCTTTGSRPAATIAWSYQSTNYIGNTTTTYDNSSRTYTVVSFLKRQVTAIDNGKSVECIVTHQTLMQPSQLTASVKLNVRFSVKASTTTIAGNKVTEATGSRALTLNCTTGSSNPESDITWMNNSVTISNNRQYTSWKGENNGHIRSQILVLYPTRYMDGDVITCSVSNMENLQSPISETATLNLNYSPLITIEGQETLTEGESKLLTCKVDGKPVATITWYHSEMQILQGTPDNNILNYNFSPVNRSHYGVYRCKADNGIGTEDEEQILIKVKFKPLSTTIAGNTNIIANGRNKLTLTCTSGSSNPISDLTWRNNTNVIQHTDTLSDLSADYGGMKRRTTLTLTPTRDNDGDVITCDANNILGISERSTATLDLKYRPLIYSMSDVIAVEGNKTILTCAASSKPVSTFRWYRAGQNDILQEGTGTLGSNELSYTIENTRRTHATTYRCNANNGIETPDNENVLLTVHYPPDITVTAANTTVKAKTAVVKCIARGVPNNNYKYGKWIQTWPGYSVPVSEKPGNEKLELEDLTYAHSGVYTCSASNEIKVFGTNKEFMEGSVLLVVKSFPIITNYSEKAPARLKENATVNVYYYSNAAGSDVKLFRKVNGSQQGGAIYTVSQKPVEVNLQVFSHVVKTSGIRAEIMIQIQSKDDIGLYDVVILNEVDSSTRSLEIVPKGPPNEPYNITVDDIQHYSAKLSWIRGYHGGFAQTFVIQLSTDKTNWRNITVVGGKEESEKPVSKILSNLQSLTTYYVRMYAFNQEGNSPYTDYLNYTTLLVEEEDPGSNMSAVIGGAAGGSFALLIIVIVLVILKRRGFFTKGKGHSYEEKTDRKPVYEDENDYGMQDNPMYVSAGPRNQEQAAGGSGSGDAGAVYSTVDKKKVAASSNDDVYAEVDKSKKTKTNNGKKEKKEKTRPGFLKDKKGKKLMQEGDIYENATATELKDTLSKQSKNDETIYENPEPSKPTRKKNVNKDGLIYADLTFNDQPKGQKKLVIHGLDSMTEYVQVDFTKKADPLPDSDEENNPTSK